MENIKKMEMIREGYAYGLEYVHEGELCPCGLGN